MPNVMLTTTDNPFDPFTQYDAWSSFDEDHGYHTCAYLARIARTSNLLTEEDEAAEIENAIDEIIKYNVLGIYKKVQEDI